MLLTSVNDAQYIFQLDLGRTAAQYDRTMTSVNKETQESCDFYLLCEIRFLFF